MLKIILTNTGLTYFPDTIHSDSVSIVPESLRRCSIVEHINISCSVGFPGSNPTVVSDPIST